MPAHKIGEGAVARRKTLNAFRKAHGLCTQCVQTRPILRPKTTPPQHGSTIASETDRAALKQQIATLHPDRNGGSSPDPHALQSCLAKLHRTRQQAALHVAVGFKIFARKAWWLVQSYGSGGWYHCSRKVPTTTSSVAPVVKEATIHISEMTDARCGPRFAWRMVSAQKTTHWGIPWQT